MALPPESTWATLPTSRAEAKRLGEKYFMKPCVHEHNVPRWTSDGKCSTCKRETDTRARHRKMGEQGTEAYWNTQAARKKMTPEQQRERDRTRRARRLTAKQLRVDRRPPGQPRDEWQAIKAMYAEAKARGLIVDHVVPFIHPLLAGLHTLVNLQLVATRVNTRKHNRIVFTPEQAEEFVRSGMAVWASDVDYEGERGRCGNVDWSRYPQHERKPVQRRHAQNDDSPPVTRAA